MSKLEGNIGVGAAAFFVALWLLLKKSEGESETGTTQEQCLVATSSTPPQAVLQWLSYAQAIAPVEYAEILAIVWQESAGNANATGQTCGGEIGLMQLCPATAQGLGYPDPQVLYDPYKNIQAGATYYREALEATGNVFDAFRYYNGGPLTLQRPDLSAQYACEVMKKFLRLIQVI